MNENIYFIKYNRKNEVSSQERFERRVASIANQEYRVVGELKSYSEEVEFKHLNCKQTFKMKPSAFISGTRCPICNSSKGESKIMLFLNKMGANYKRQYSIPGLTSKRNKSLRFDFAVLDDNNVLLFLIEFDGRHHYEKAKGKLGDGFEKQKEHDALKDSYCMANNIKLIRIPYWKYKNIEKILMDQLCN